MYSKVHVVGFVRYMWWDVWGPCDGICEVHVVGCVRYMCGVHVVRCVRYTYVCYSVS